MKGLGGFFENDNCWRAVAAAALTMRRVRWSWVYGSPMVMVMMAIDLAVAFGADRHLDG